MNPFGGEDDDRESGGSPDGSSDNDQDGPMEDRDDEDMDGNEAPEADADGEGENEEENEDEDDEQDQDDSQYTSRDDPDQAHTKPVETSQASSTRNPSDSLRGQAGVGGPTISAPTSHPKPSMLPTSPSPTQDSATSNGLGIELPKIRPEVLTATVYDIVPTIAAPHSTSINSITATPDLRWVFTGGADGYIRKFNWLETANGKSMLTVAQRHPFVDSVTKAGILMSYWDNTEDFSAGKPSEESSSLSSVYSLAVQREGLWLLSGLESGGINVQSVRHDEGKQITCLRGHTSVVSVLNLAQDEKSVLSGSWDKSVLDWDLNTGKIVRNFEGSGGQLSALETRPLSSLPVPEASGDVVELNGTISTDSTDKPRINGTAINDSDFNAQHEVAVNGDAGSPTDSLFGGNDGDSLFGDNDNEAPGAPSGGNFVDDDDDEFSRAIANGIRDQEHDQEQEKPTKDLEGDTDMKDNSQSSTTGPINGNPQTPKLPDAGVAIVHIADQESSGPSETVRNRLPHSDELFSIGESGVSASADLPEAPPSSDSTFLAASFDGSLRVWDKRQKTPIAKITPQNVPPWCMNACWSPDGNFIYAGRRNGTVDEYSLHKGLRGAERSFKLPNNSGPVSAVRAMPNGRHLICASYDILRLYDLQQQQIFKHATVPFLIVPGHRTGVVSHLYLDPTYDHILPEWGIQFLRQNNEGKKVSAYIQSTTDVSFQVSLRPDIPFVGDLAPSDTPGGEKVCTKKKSRRLKADSEDRSSDQDHERMNNNTLSSPVRPSRTPQSHSAPDFAFLAALYLDGRRIPERKIIVYTDPADKDFNSPDGKVAFKHRWVQSAGGKMTEHAWVFKEKAIETVFDKLMIAGSQASVEDQDDDALIKAMESSGFDAQGETEKGGKVGQIVVELRRIVLGEKRTQTDYRPHHQDGQDEDVDMEGVRPDITHATGFVQKKTLESQPLRVVEYWPYKSDEGLYATFQFFYRSREQLQRFRFPGFPTLSTTKTTARTKRLLNAQLADLAPLSIALPLNQKAKTIRNYQDSYEAKVKRRGFKPDESQKHDFGSGYRDRRANSPSAVDEAYQGKKPRECLAAPSSFLNKKSFENIRIDPLSPMTSPTAEAAVLSQQSMASDFKHKLQPQGHARRSLNADTPTSLTARPSSSLPSSTDVFKEQLANIKDKNSYRLSTGDSYRSDQEEDADDEHARESDLETHAGDDDFNYAAYPEEEDEGYDTLQSRFRDVRIRKRRRDEVEVAEDDNQTSHGNDAAHSDGNGKQKALKLPLTEEELEHRGKKSRTAKTSSAASAGQNAQDNEDTQDVRVGQEVLP